MPSWFFIALGAPFLWAVSNYIDKFLISKYFRNSSGALIIFSAVSGMIVMPFVLIFHRGTFDVAVGNAVTMIVAGTIGIFALIPYFYALRRDDASLVVPIFQLVPVFSYILARVFLNETLTGGQIVAGVIILLGAIGISMDFSRNKVRIKGKTLSLMLLSSLLMSTTNFLFKKVGIVESFWVTTFWVYVGYTFAALILFSLIPAYRRQFLEVIRKNPRIVGVNFSNELLNLVAVTLFTFATLLGPLALVTLVNSFQALFVFLIGAFLTVYRPNLIKENISRGEIFQKLLAIGVMLFGAYLLNQSL